MKSIVCMIFPREDKLAAARQKMVQRHLRGRNITDERVLEAFERIPRERFVPGNHKSQAYADGPLPIGAGQTISQPYIVALMTESLQVKPDSEVLEIGTGCGYQTAILCELAKKVYSVEKIAELADKAKATLAELGITNAEFHVGDGSCGWPEEREFERIMVTAAVPRVPKPLIGQLAEGGLIVVPVGPMGMQRLVVGRKQQGQFIKEAICDVRFVKLLGKYGF